MSSQITLNQLHSDMVHDFKVLIVGIGILSFLIFMTIVIFTRKP